MTFNTLSESQPKGKTMGYRDDFFIVSNIVGYTGDLQDNPTVYFETDEEQAHITQAHKKADNVGRGAVFTTEGYSKVNVFFEDDHAEHLVEMYDGKKIHKSRNKFIAVPHLENRPALLKILEKAILAHTKIKSRYVKYEKLKNLTISKSALAKKEKFQLPQGPGRSRSNAFSSM